MASISALRQMEPAKLVKLVRGELDWIVMKCLEKDRNRRYETANSLSMDIQRYLADEPVQACPPSVGYRVRKFVKRNRGPVLAASFVLAALLAGIVGTTWGLVVANRARGLAKDEAKRAHRRLYFAHMNLAQAAWQDALVARVLELLGAHQPKPGEEDLRGFEWHYLQRLSHSYRLNLKGHTHGVRSVAISPNGQRLASASHDQTVKVWDLDKGGQKFTLEGHTAGVTSVAFSPNTVRIRASHSQLILCVCSKPRSQGGCDDDGARMLDVLDR